MNSRLTIGMIMLAVLAAARIAWALPAVEQLGEDLPATVTHTPSDEVQPRPSRNGRREVGCNRVRAVYSPPSWYEDEARECRPRYCRPRFHRCTAVGCERCSAYSPPSWYEDEAYECRKEGQRPRFYAGWVYHW